MKNSSLIDSRLISSYCFMSSIRSGVARVVFKDVILFPALLRYNQHITLYKLMIYNVLI